MEEISLEIAGQQIAVVALGATISVSLRVIPKQASSITASHLHSLMQLRASTKHCPALSDSLHCFASTLPTLPLPCPSL